MAWLLYVDSVSLSICVHTGYCSGVVPVSGHHSQLEASETGKSFSHMLPLPGLLRLAGWQDGASLWHS